ncbi:RBP11-like subunits of RNA polymerase [Mytilinidion resinicola]|uniref:RBP11-like subunits of RNA polymerase n=1 Tax=Mytilinidion resinicola TaxID=574789 RepID=A0A6A6Y6Y3_9PEZI|nr:RBP11-like subunits of RNA polymerase [Mytilinidion resinicola]KAF2804288.1 RBP11-like subunits of RNA polymerase [Mytilinidion resinicola]
MPMRDPNPSRSHLSPRRQQWQRRCGAVIRSRRGVTAASDTERALSRLLAYIFCPPDSLLPSSSTSQQQHLPSLSPPLSQHPFTPASCGRSITPSHLPFTSSTDRVSSASMPDQDINTPAIIGGNRQHRNRDRFFIRAPFAPGVHARDNAMNEVNGIDIPDRFESFLLAEGEKKVEQKDETRIPDTTTFTFNKEDHTLGNLITARLLKDERVTFAAYKVPHPLFAKFELRVSTDGTITPKNAVVKACQGAIQDLDVLARSFTTEFLGKKIVREGEAERAARENAA